MNNSAESRIFFHKKKEITIILPCAGEGKRLGLKTPKELYEIYPGQKLIDFSLTHIKHYLKRKQGNKVRVCVVIKKGKEAVYEYVKSILSVSTEVTFAHFNTSSREWPGSVYSAGEYFSAFNIVLLPDSFIQLAETDPYYDLEGKTLLDLMLIFLERSRVVFAYVKSSNKKKLGNLGALKAYKERIVEFRDKPENNRHKYNGYWVSYAFVNTVARELYQFLIDSVEHKKDNYAEQKFFPAAGVKLYRYHDLGTWESIRNFKQKNF